MAIAFRRPPTISNTTFVVGNPATVTLYNAMVPHPGAVQLAAIDALIVGLTSAGIWDKIGLMWVLAAQSAQAGYLNWKSPSTHALAGVNSPIVTPFVSIGGDGVSSYITSDVRPVTMPSPYAQDDAHLSYGIASGSATSNAMGAPSGTVLLASNPFTASGKRSTRLNASSAATGITTISARAGSRCFCRSTAVSIDMYANGVQAETVASVSAAPSGQAQLTIFGSSNGTNTNDAWQYATIGSNLTSGEAATLHSLMAGYLAAIAGL